MNVQYHCTQGTVGESKPEGDSQGTIPNPWGPIPLPHSQSNLNLQLYKAFNEIHSFPDIQSIFNTICNSMYLIHASIPFAIQSIIAIQYHLFNQLEWFLNLTSLTCLGFPSFQDSVGRGFAFPFDSFFPG